MFFTNPMMYLCCAIFLTTSNGFLYACRNKNHKTRYFVPCCNSNNDYEYEWYGEVPLYYTDKDDNNNNNKKKKDKNSISDEYDTREEAWKRREEEWKRREEEYLEKIEKFEEEEKNKCIGKEFRNKLRELEKMNKMLLKCKKSKD